MPNVASEIKSGYQVGGEPGPVIDQSNVKGGYHTVADLTERDSIPTTLRSQGMKVWVQNINEGFVLQPNMTSWVSELDAVAETNSRKFVSGKDKNSLIPLEYAASGTLNPTSGDIGALLFAIVDALDNLGAGLGTDGVWVANKLRALTALITPLLTAGAVNTGTVTATGNVSSGGTVTAQTVNASQIASLLLSSLVGGSLSFDDFGSVKRKQGGPRLDVLDGDFQAAITDSNDNVFAGIKDGAIYGPGSVTRRQKGAYVDRLYTVYFNGVEVEIGAHNYDFCVCDPNGNVLIGYMNGTFYNGSSSTLDSTLDIQDRKNKLYTQTLHNTRVNTIQRPTADYNALFVYGQSLGQGDETWPALSRTNRFGNLMYGGSVQPSSTGTTFTPQGGSGTFQPLIAVTINTSGVALDDAGEAALPAGNGARGEPINHGWTNGARFALAQYLFDEDYSKKRFISLNVSVSGATIGELEKNHTEGSSERYGRYSDGLTRIQALATGESKKLVIAGIGYLQGEHDYFQANGHTSLNITYANYKVKLEGMIANMQNDAIATTSQSLPPPFFMYQTGAAYTRDVDINGVPGMHVGMAQLDVALASDKAWMVGPVYPYTDKGGHLDSNGSRWFGHQYAKVYEHVVIKGKDWEPLRPIRIWKSGTDTIYVSYHVPVAPLIFDEPQLSGGTEYNNSSKGFRVTDDTGSMAVSDISIVRDTIIRIVCPRAIGVNPKLWYASQGNSGNGMVRDSDPSLAIDTYEYVPERGMYTSANIAQFVNKPYPLWNWGVGFFLPVEV